MVSHKNYNLGASEGFVIILTSKLIACFIDGFTLIVISQSVACLLNGNEYIHIFMCIYIWVVDLEGEVHSIWDLWISDLHKCKGNSFFEVG